MNVPDLATRVSRRCLLVDWGDTVMRVFPEQSGPMFRWPRVEAIPGAEEALGRLGGPRGSWRIALATNAADSDEADIRKALARVGLDGLFERIYCFARVGHKKPSAEFFGYVLEDLKLPCTSVVMVGDEFERDVLGANACGIRGVWLNRITSEVREGAMYQTARDWEQVAELLGA